MKQDNDDNHKYKNKIYDDDENGASDKNHEHEDMTKYAKLMKR